MDYNIQHSMRETISEQNLAAICKKLSIKDKHLARVFKSYGTPPLWDIEESFSGLVYIILGQQVSLASAKACFIKLEQWLVDITPEKFLELSDTELKQIGFSRQKTLYGRIAAEAILDESLDLEKLNELPDREVKTELEKLKGIGKWTSDIYLLMVMLRPDIMPKGDIALHQAWKDLSDLHARPKAEEFIEMAVRWKPYRSVAARLLWHFYLSEKAQDKRKVIVPNAAKGK